MFHKLRNRLILINVAITTVVLISAFAAIYAVAQDSTHRRMTFHGGIELSQYDLRFVQEQIESERRAALNSLLISLVVVGLLVETAVIILSYCLAEIAIQPVRENYEAQKIFIANASHEIKTPLAVMSANLEAAAIQDNHWIENVEKELKTLTMLNQNLLALARADNMRDSTEATSEKTKSKINVHEMFVEIAESFAAKAQEKKIKLEINAKSKHVNVNADDLRQTLIILVDNAIKYGKKKVTLDYQENIISVTNDGATIPEKDLGKVFERFYQVDKTAEGSGLGLAIAKSLAERNGWEIGAESNGDETRFWIRLKS